jgi:cytochrome b6-f complex iron-sulfur subunit
MDENQLKDTTIRRRSFLKLAGSAAAATAMGGFSACGSPPEGSGVVEVPLESLPVGGRLRVIWGELPVELTRGVDGVTARSLWCTHSGCEVKWKEDRQIYFCACHEGEYDADGVVIAGPPPRPLADIPITVSDTTIVVGEIV